MNSRAEENKPFVKAITNIREVIRLAQDAILNNDDKARIDGMVTISMLARALTMAGQGDFSIIEKKPADEAQNDEIKFDEVNFDD